jgi:tetratricopeptide (TPR) repeat protein
MSQKSKKKATPEKVAAIPSGALGLNDHWTVLGICIFLAAITWAVFGQTLRHGFIDFDDGADVYENRMVAQGLTLKGIVWSFSFHSSNWFPLTWLSHMLDCQLYGLHPGGHHLTNVLLHIATVILLFLVLRRMTGALWRSAFVAAVFAIHPLRVESVAWVAERKDVLSGMFFMLTIGAYVRYACRPWSSARYGLVVFLFALGLMCKPMLVTLPLVLVLLDYWPLNRLLADAAGEPVFRLGGWPIAKRIVFEKLPLFGLMVASCVITVFAQHKALQTFENMSIPTRLGNASISYVTYLGQMFWPSRLAILYPFTAGSVGVSKVSLSLILLAGISAGAFVLCRRCPWFLAGWLWYLIMLAPVIGILQVGSQAHADRYTYLPQIGLYLLLTWAVADLCAGWRHRRLILGGLSAITLSTLIFCARAQTAYWRNSESLWAHTLACTSDNPIAHNNLGYILLRKGKVDDASIHFQEALQIKPDYAEANYNLGIVLRQKGNVDDAIAHYQRALQIKPDYADAHVNLGNILFQKGKVDEAIVHFQEALQIKPDIAEAHISLGGALLQKGRVDEAIDHYQQALQINPDDANVHYNLAGALLQKGRLDEAIDHYQQALQINPDDAEVQINLGNALRQKGNTDEAIIHYQKALELARAAGRQDIVDGLSAELKSLQGGK